MQNIKNNLAILVVSCDKYADLWKPFFECFRRFWPGCPFEVYLLSNEIDYKISGVKNIRSGKGISWSDDLRTGIEQLEEEYVMLFLDDLLLCRDVDTQKVTDIVSWAIKSKVNYVRMNPMQNKADKPFNKYIGILSPKAIYRASTVMSVWKKDVLLDLLKVGESAWDFEVHGSIRSDKYDKFYAAWKVNFPVINTVIKGKWRRAAVRKMKTLGVGMDLTSRQVMTASETIVLRIKEFRSRILSFLPAKYRREVKNFMSGGKYHYQ